ncbi:MAG: helix-turn-helix transcriptional regulator [Oscillospiraceae bacterium]|nr:helix-turn-helix transcriptional regulator [Oscillospiraceae bacterium]
MSDTYLPGDTRQRIQDLIKNRKITQAELAEKVGLSNSAISRYLQGSTKNLGDGYIIRIAKYFDVSTDFLLGETDIPDRKNYDIEELGLSAETAKLLYTGKVDASVLNQLIEHPRFPQLLLLLARYQDETMIAGINAMNQVMNFSRSFIIGQAKLHPEDAEAAGEAAKALQLLSTPPVAADTTAIQTLFMQIARDIKKNAESTAEEKQKATAEVLNRLRANLTKDGEAVDLSKLTAEEVTAAVMKTISEAGIPEEMLSSLGISFLDLLNALKEPDHDE